MECVIRIKGSRIFVENSVGPVKYKHEITPQRFAQIFFETFADTYKTADYDYETPLLPKGTVGFKADHDLSKFAAAILVCAERRRIVYFNDVFEVPHPDLIFFFKVKNRKVLDSRVFAVKSELIEKDAELCCFPFGNVYSDGTICWGSNTLPDIDKPLKLEQLPYLFFDSPYNGDLYRGEKPFRMYLKELEKMPVFPAETLRPYARFREFFKNF